jgi:hypothetical protein
VSDHCCAAMRNVIENPVRDNRGVKWQTMYNTKTGEESLDLVYHCGGGYWKAPVIKLKACPFCLKPVRSIAVDPQDTSALSGEAKETP